MAGAGGNEDLEELRITFEALFPRLVQDVAECSESPDVGQPIKDWIVKIMEYNCPHGKKAR